MTTLKEFCEEIVEEKMYQMYMYSSADVSTEASTLEN